MTKLLTCPECGSVKVRVSACSSYDANTGEFVVHSFKTHDANTRAFCGEYDCDWVGVRSDLKGQGNE